MPGKPLGSEIQKYVDAFAEFPKLKQNRFCFLIDCSSKLFKAKKPTLKDVEGNTEASLHGNYQCEMKKMFN